MRNGYFKIPQPVNEKAKDYLPGAAEREELKKELKRQSDIKVEIPIIIGGKEYRTGNTGTCVMPHDHTHVLAECHIAGEKELKLAAEAAMAAKQKRAEMPWEHRASIFFQLLFYEASGRGRPSLYRVNRRVPGRLVAGWREY